MQASSTCMQQQMNMRINEHKVSLQIAASSCCSATIFVQAHKQNTRFGIGQNTIHAKIAKARVNL